jgi:biopolymer transport protein ExbB
MDSSISLAETILEGAGWFIYPLGLCSSIALFIIVERLLSLRIANVAPDALFTVLAKGVPAELPRPLARTAGGRIISFYTKNNPDPETLKAYAQLELTRLERGLFLLDTIVSGAPLIGLLGTVWGLFLLFPKDGSMPSSASLTHGVGMALTTTMLGLGIALPALLGSGYLSRRIEVLSARINMAVERLCAFAVAGDAAGETTGNATGSDTAGGTTAGTAATGGTTTKDAADKDAPLSVLDVAFKPAPPAPPKTSPVPKTWAGIRPAAVPTAPPPKSTAGTATTAGTAGITGETTTPGETATASTDPPAPTAPGITLHFRP